MKYLRLISDFVGSLRKEDVIYTTYLLVLSVSAGFGLRQKKVMKLADKVLQRWNDQR
jgi:hypothetical protein